MATMVKISDDAKARADELVEQGHFDSVDQVVETAMGHLAYGYGYSDDSEEELDPDKEADALIGVSDEDREAIREGLRDIKEGRVLTMAEVFDPFLAELRAMQEARSNGAGR